MSKPGQSKLTSRAFDAQRQETINTACDELRAFFKAGRLPYSLALEVLDRVAEELRGSVKPHYSHLQ